MQITSEQIQERAEELYDHFIEKFNKDGNDQTDYNSFLLYKLAELELKIESLKKE